MDDYTTLDQSSLNSVLGGSNGSLIPESLAITLTISFILLNILALVFAVFWIIGLVRRWKVQTAVLHMQKDIAEIKQQLIKPVTEATPAPAEDSQPEPTPAQSDTPSTAA